MNIINVHFDLKNLFATIEFNGIKKQEKINITTINKWIDMASISWHFDENDKNKKKWVFIWQIWAELEQFVKFEEYKRPCENDNNPKPWTTFAKWSYISKPSKGTLQKDKLYQNLYDSKKFPEIDEVNISVTGSKYGDINTKNCKDYGYWY